MAVLRICALSKSTWDLKDISLRQKCRDVNIDEIKSDNFSLIIRDMFETLYSTPSGVGLAAPQVGIQLRIVVVDIKRDTKKPLVLINPSYVPIGDETEESTESCLSVPDVVGNVSRYKRVKITYLDIKGDVIERELEGFDSIVMQHEIDHTNGILYVDKLIEGSVVTPDFGHVHRMANKAIGKL